MHTLIRFMGHVTERPGKYFMLSRQTLYHMAYTPGAVLAWIERKNAMNYIRYPCGGLVFVPDDAREGMHILPTFVSIALEQEGVSYKLESRKCSNATYAAAQQHSPSLSMATPSFLAKTRFYSSAF